MACFVIHLMPGLSASDHARALELGPTEVAAEDDVVPMLECADFAAIEQVDVTDTFLQSCKTYHEVRDRYAGDLRRVEGDEDFEDEQSKQRGHIEAVNAGLLQRSLLLAERPR